MKRIKDAARPGSELAFFDQVDILQGRMNVRTHHGVAATGDVFRTLAHAAVQIIHNDPQEVIGKHVLEAWSRDLSEDSSSILNALAASRNPANAAKKLGISRQRLDYKLNRCGLK